MDIAWEDRAANFKIAERLISEAGVREGDLVVLPEMFDSGFSLNVERTADDAGETADWVERMARESGSHVQGARTVWNAARLKGRNLAVAAGPGGMVCEYAKIHPFGYGGESERFEGGDEVLTYEWGVGAHGLCVCPAVCYDLRFPELFRRGLALGAQVFTVVASWPAARHEHWRALLIARAIENQAYVLGVNRCGSDPRLEYAGGTVAVGPRGEIVGELGGDEGVLSVEVEHDEIKKWRARFPAWRDIRL